MLLYNVELKHIKAKFHQVQVIHLFLSPPLSLFSFGLQIFMFLSFYSKLVMQFQLCMLKVKEFAGMRNLHLNSQSLSGNTSTILNSQSWMRNSSQMMALSVKPCNFYHSETISSVIDLTNRKYNFSIF